MSSLLLRGMFEVSPTLTRRLNHRNLYTLCLGFLHTSIRFRSPVPRIRETLQRNAVRISLQMWCLQCHVLPITPLSLNIMKKFQTTCKINELYIAMPLCNLGVLRSPNKYSRSSNAFTNADLLLYRGSS
jgi:hypothetical protein